MTKEYTTYEQLNPVFVFLLLCSEDFNFFFHRGIDISYIVYSLTKNILSRSKACGGSTITQQLMKNLYLTKKKIFIRKLIEFILAKRYELKYSKYDILEKYCNIIPWGNGCIGISEASHYYFNKSQKDLTIDEILQLVCCIPNPHLNNPKDYPKENEICRQRLIQRYYKANMFSLKYAYNLIKFHSFGSESLDLRFIRYSTNTLTRMAELGSHNVRYKFRDITRFKGLDKMMIL